MSNAVSLLSTCSISEMETQAAAARSSVECVPPIFQLEFLKSRQWICVAIEDELERDAATKLAQACIVYNFAMAWALEIPWITREINIVQYKLPLSMEAIQELTKDAYIGSCFLITENDRRFAVASDGDLYWMLAGPKAFVQTALNVTWEVQLAKFEKVVKAYERSNSIAGHRLRAAQTIAIAACSET